MPTVIEFPESRYSIASCGYNLWDTCNSSAFQRWLCSNDFISFIYDQFLLMFAIRGCIRISAFDSNIKSSSIRYFGHACHRQQTCSTRRSNRCKTYDVFELLQDLIWLGTNFSICRYLALTYDHRIIDGRESVTFLKRIRQAVEDPRKMLLDLVWSEGVLMSD